MSKSEVMGMLGKPSRKVLVSANSEQWFYSFIEQKTNLAAYIPYVNLIADQAESDSKELQILFEDGTVQNFAMTTISDTYEGGLIEGTKALTRDKSVTRDE